MTVAARALIAGSLQTIINAGRPGLAVQYDPNASFEPPHAAPWLRLTILDGDEQQVGIGGDSAPYRAPVLAYFDIFVPGGSGDGDAKAIDTLIRDGFRRWTAAGLRTATFRSGVEGRGSGEDAALYRKQTIIVFTLSFRG